MAAVQALEAILAEHARGRPGCQVAVNGSHGGLVLYRPGLSEPVVLYERSAGTSLCSAYHPSTYVHETLARGFDVVGFRPAGDDGKHDIHLLRKQ